jgi:hypothetical protein
MSALVLLMTVEGFGDVPALVSFQGRLSNSQGEPIDTIVTMTFTIYDARIGGSAVWSEVQPGIQVEDGLFQVRLGKGQALADGVFADSVRWLGVAVGADSEISPRTQMVAVPWAMRVNTVDSALGGVVKGHLTVTEGLSVGLDNYTPASQTLCVGSSNSAEAEGASVTGGHGNHVYGENSVVGGGAYNVASGRFATVPGGINNVAEAENTFAAGSRAAASHDGSIVFSAYCCST